ncbi:MAG: hypothetical protein ACFB02_16655 [Mastigocoleus sp.]
MQTKQKVTLYLSPELHKKLKIRSAVDAEPMSELAERALGFYLENTDLVDEVEGSHGRTHKVYSCPSCESSVVIRDRELVSLGNQPGIIGQDCNSSAQDLSENGSSPESEEELVPC